MKESILKKLKICVDNAKPNEACGLIFGNKVEINRNGDFQYHFTAEDFICIESTEKSPVYFLMRNDAEFYNNYRKYENEMRLDLLSIFHSHPAGSYPSGLDDEFMRQFYNSGMKKFIYFIWTIMDASNYKLNGFIYLENELNQIDIKIVK